ncbi:MAG TPA: response regulator, partial [Polyangiaceae bacterium]
MTEVMPLLLVVEDDPQMRKFLRASLTSHGYRLVEAVNGADGLTQAASYNPDLILLDLGLPDLDGLVVTKRLREWASAPIIVISARGQEDDKIHALDAGADDYLTKPFGTGELLARIRVALRHSGRSRQERTEPILTVGELSIDLDKRSVHVAGKEVHLTPIEYKLLATL